MKKRVSAELISIAHRILKLKNHSETVQLQQEAKNLYDQLTILRFYEENFELVKNEISEEVLEAKLEGKQADIFEQPIAVVEEIAPEREVEVDSEVSEPIAEEKVEEKPIVKPASKPVAKPVANSKPKPAPTAELQRAEGQCHGDAGESAPAPAAGYGPAARGVARLVAP